MNDLQTELAAIHARQQLASDYQKTLALLRALKAGTIKLDEFEMTADGWNLIEPSAEMEDSDAESV